MVGGNVGVGSPVVAPTVEDSIRDCLKDREAECDIRAIAEEYRGRIQQELPDWLTLIDNVFYGPASSDWRANRRKFAWVALHLAEAVAHVDLYDIIARHPLPSDVGAV
jgi:hypothetical protein